MVISTSVLVSLFAINSVRDENHTNTREELEGMKTVVVTNVDVEEFRYSKHVNYIFTNRSLNPQYFSFVWHNVYRINFFHNTFSQLSLQNPI